MAIGTGTLKGGEFGVGDTPDEDAFVSAVDGDGTADGHQGRKVGLVDVDGTPGTERGVANSVATACCGQQHADG